MGRRSPGGSASSGEGSGAEGPRRWMCGRPARRPDDSRRCFSSLQRAQSSFRSSLAASIGIDVASAEHANSFSLCRASRRHTTTAESTVSGSRARQPQLLESQEFAMDRSHPTPRAREKPIAPKRWHPGRQSPVALSCQLRIALYLAARGEGCRGSTWFRRSAWRAQGKEQNSQPKAGVQQLEANQASRSSAPWKSSRASASDSSCSRGRYTPRVQAIRANGSRAQPSHPDVIRLPN